MSDTNGRGVVVKILLEESGSRIMLDIMWRAMMLEHSAHKFII